MSLIKGGRQLKKSEAALQINLIDESTTLVALVKRQMAITNVNHM